MSSKVDMIIRMLQVWILSKPPTSSNKHWKTVSFLSQAEVISSAFKTKVPHSDLYSWLHQWLTEPNLGLLTQRAAKPIYWYWVVAKKSVSCSIISDSFATPWTVAQQAPLSMEFSRQEDWNGLPFPFSRGSFQSRDQTWVSCIAGRFFTIWAIKVYCI